jgi:hypothetical protein
MDCDDMAIKRNLSILMVDHKKNVNPCPELFRVIPNPVVSDLSMQMYPTATQTHHAPIALSGPDIKTL